ncbi:MAG: methyltransferase domain-containing protein [Chloroflexi bacterium]|jgi:SAM-dependent methyltransferase|nr:methyltransferase domain-containing protein [Chloroflexota bacterium]
MSLTPQDWHARFSQQAQWTRALRAHLFPRMGFNVARQILDVGCGTGALFGELLAQSDAAIFGVDIQRQHLRLARTHKDVLLSQGDALQMPYANEVFDITLCHFLLLWVANPVQALSEMARVTRPGGMVLALAEPDYGGRIDFPTELEQIGAWQTESLRRQGADPLIGRKLSGLFHHVGFENIETGVLGGQWRGAPTDDAWKSEWSVLESDFAQTSEFSGNSNVLKQLDAGAWASGQRVLFVPTFYAIGWVRQL